MRTKCDPCIDFVLEKTSFVYFATGTEFKICRDSTSNTKNMYLAYWKSVINKVLDLASNGNHD